MKKRLKINEKKKVKTRNEKFKINGRDERGDLAPSSLLTESLQNAT